MINLPIEIGDIILTGRFKNHKVQVKEIGIDDFGLPTINGKGILKIRIEKLMKRKEENNLKLSNLIKSVLKEADFTGTDLEKEIQEYADLSDEMDRLKAKLEELQNKFTELDKKFRDMLTKLAAELGETSDTFLRAKNILISIKKKGYDRTNYKYKEAFEWLNSRVSPQMKKLVAEALEANKSVTYIESKLGVQRESKLRENWLTELYGKVKNFIVSKIASLRKNNQGANQSLDKLEGLL